MGPEIIDFWTNFGTILGAILGKNWLQKGTKNGTTFGTLFPRISGVGELRFCELNESAAKATVTGIILPKRKGGIRPFKGLIRPFKGLIPPFLLPSIIPVTVAFAALSFNLQKRIIRTSEMRSKRVPKVVPFLVPFWSQLWLQNGPQNGPKIGPNIDNFGAHFWIPFLLGLGALRLPLGSLLGPPKALLGGLWTPKS